MKKTMRVLAIYATLGLLPVFTNVIELKAQTATPSPAAQGQCTDETKAAWYADFIKYRTTEPPKAYEPAKKYLAACPTEEGQIPNYLKKWVIAYEKEARKLKLTPLLYGDKKYPEALALGKEILADEPENLRVSIDLGYGSYWAAVTLKNESYNADGLTYIRKAIQMIEAGKTPEAWTPFKGKDDTLAYLYNYLGRITLKTNPPGALRSLIKAAQYETELKKDPWIYFFIANAYETGPYVTLSADYKAKFEGKDETPESKLALANIQQVIDRMVDAYARAVALAGTDPKYQANKKEWLESLTTWYKYRHNQSDVGLTDLLASVVTKPLPPEPTPITTLPATAPTTSSTPATGSTTTAGSTVAPGTVVPPATNKTTTTAPAATGATTTPPKKTTTTTQTASTKPAAKPTRNNHRRH